MTPSEDGLTVSRDDESVVEAAVKAHRRSWTPLPVRAGTKSPSIPGWPRMSFESEQDVREKFEEWNDEGHTNLGVLLGERSSNLVDIDLDHPRTARLKRYFLPPTDMITGREGGHATHYWYVCEPGTLPGNRRHKMPDKTMAVELRSTGSQTLLPPSVHPQGETYTWDYREWGEPATVDGQVLTVQVALLGLGTVLIDSWPEQGGRHEAYLALAGGVLRNTDGGVHPYWERNLEVLIRALADATHDDDGPESRVTEVMGTTLKRIRDGENVQGFGKLGEILGRETTRQVRVLMREVESSAGYVPRDTSAVEQVSETAQDPHSSDEGDIGDRYDRLQDEVGGLDPEERDPLDERLASWQPVDLEPYLAGQVRMPEPEVLSRDDGANLLYRGRVNMLFGSSESAKSWIALYTCIQEMSKGERVVYLDFEDEPIQTLDRMQRLGAGHDDIRAQFNYIRPEEPLAPMQRSRWGQHEPTQKGEDNESLFEKALDDADPSLIVVDGMTVLYGLHGLDSNDSVSTDVITTWLKKLARNGRSTVIIIDHTGKGGKKGTMPIGSQHKVAMVQGTLLQVYPLSQPMPGRVGEVELVVVKDRPGKVRAISQEAEEAGSKAQVSARVLMDSTEEGVTTMKIRTPAERGDGEINLQSAEAARRAVIATEWEERVKHVFEGELGRALSMPAIQDELDVYGDKTAVRSAVNRLVDQGWLDARGRTKGKKYVLMVGGAGYETPEEETDFVNPEAEEAEEAPDDTDL